MNLIVGPNAAGKTTILEAVYMLGLGRSFRTRSITRLIKNGEKELQILGKTLNDGRGQSIGISRTRDKFQIRINRESHTRLSELAAVLPVQCLTPETHFGFFKSAKHRRAALDWGVFHVEQDFIKTWSNYRKVLKQRNAALKASLNEKQFEPWENQLMENADKIHKQRTSFMNNFIPLVKQFSNKINAGLDIAIDLAKGWPEKTSLQNALAQNRQLDKRRGFTLYGPHRGDLKIRIDGKNADLASSGQQKLAVIAIRLAQIVMMNKVNKVAPILLLDDLMSELDSRHREAVLDILPELPAQIFMTATGMENIGEKQSIFGRTFHVEQGRIH